MPRENQATETAEGGGTGLAGRKVLVVGGSRGIGAAAARRFSQAGADVVVGCRTAAGEAAALVDELARDGRRSACVTGDVSRPDEAAAIVAEAHGILGGLDILVNTAGINPYLPLAEIDEEHYRAVFDTNVLGAIALTKAVAPLLPAAGGRIVHVASRLACDPFPSSAVYAASKAAVIALVHGFARELGPRGITVNAVAPGLVETDMTRGIIAARGEQTRAATPLGRIGQPDDIAGIIVFLASDAARWITGRTILADGGMS